MSRCIDLTGQRFEKLTVIKRVENTKQGMAQWLCRCDCGNEIIVSGINLRSKHTKSCGCLRVIAQYESHKRFNQYDLTGEYGIGYTSKGEEFYFDLEDYEKIKDYSWYINKDGYVASKPKEMMHRVIMNCPSDKLVDHKHGEDTRNDNRKENLRVCTRQENNRNRKPKSDTKSGVAGVVWHYKNKKWVAQIAVNKKNIYLGSFEKKEDAIKARKEAEDRYFGEFSYDNSMRDINGQQTI